MSAYDWAGFAVGMGLFVVSAVFVLTEELRMSKIPALEAMRAMTPERFAEALTQMTSVDIGRAASGGYGTPYRDVFVANLLTLAYKLLEKPTFGDAA